MVPIASPSESSRTNSRGFPEDIRIVDPPLFLFSNDGRCHYFGRTLLRVSDLPSVDFVCNVDSPPLIWGLIPGEKYRTVTPPPPSPTLVNVWLGVGKDEGGGVLGANAVL